MVYKELYKYVNYFNVIFYFKKYGCRLLHNILVLSTILVVISVLCIGIVPVHDNLLLENKILGYSYHIWH